MNKLLSLRHALLVAVACVMISGCSKPAPSDMPATVAYKVKVVNGSKGIADVQVVMDSVDGQGVGAIAGTTNSSGVAEMKTTYKGFTAKGVPAGEYKVRCIKDPVVDHWKTDDELAAMDIAGRQAYFDEWMAKNKELPREVPEIFSNFDKCPVTVGVVEAGETVIDVSEYEK